MAEVRDLSGHWPKLGLDEKRKIVESPSLMPLVRKHFSMSGVMFTKARRVGMLNHSS